VTVAVVAQTEQKTPQTVTQAWAAYLNETRDVDRIRYPEVEAWAWARLQSRLRILKRRRS
jgi:hypothetical protein